MGPTVLVSEVGVAVVYEAFVVVDGSDEAVPPSCDLHDGDFDFWMCFVEAHEVFVGVAEEGLVLVREAGEDLLWDVG